MSATAKSNTRMQQILKGSLVLTALDCKLRLIFILSDQKMWQIPAIVHLRLLFYI
jgi:hypothetical protein